MEISGYGITLRRLTEDKIEMVRNWRNDPKIQQYMEFRDYITPEMQKKWFERINNDNNYYFIIIYEGKEIGLINIKDIDNTRNEGEAGVFIYDDEFLNTDVSYRAHIVLFDYFYDIIGLKNITSHILIDNNRASRFALYLGSKKTEFQDFDDNIKYELKREDYINNTNRLRFVKKWYTLNKHI